LSENPEISERGAGVDTHPYLSHALSAWGPTGGLGDWRRRTRALALRLGSEKNLSPTALLDELGAPHLHVGSQPTDASNARALRLRKTSVLNSALDRALP